MYFAISESVGGRELHEDIGFLGYVAFMRPLFTVLYLVKVGAGYGGGQRKPRAVAGFLNR